MLDLELDFTARGQQGRVAESFDNGYRFIHKGSAEWEEMLAHMASSHLFVTPCKGVADAAASGVAFHSEPHPSDIRLFFIALELTDPLDSSRSGSRLVAVLASPKKLGVARKIAELWGGDADRDEEKLASAKYIFCDGMACPPEVLTVHHQLLAAALNAVRGI